MRHFVHVLGTIVLNAVSAKTSSEVRSMLGAEVTIYGGLVVEVPEPMEEGAYFEPSDGLKKVDMGEYEGWSCVEEMLVAQGVDGFDDEPATIQELEEVEV